MKTQKEIEELYSLIGFFNDGFFMNQDYRKGIQHALGFVLYNNTVLERIIGGIKREGEE